MTDYHALLEQWSERQRQLFENLDPNDVEAANELVLVAALVRELEAVIAASEADMPAVQTIRLGPDGKPI